MLLIQYLSVLLNPDTLLFYKSDRFFGLSSTSTVENLLNNADADMSLAHDCLALLIVQQLDKIIALVCMILASG